MVEFNIRLPPTQNVVWVPKEIVDAFGRRLTLLPNSVAAVIYPKDADLQAVLKSLRIIQQQLELRIELDERRR